jgi:citrate synthase
LNRIINMSEWIGRAQALALLGVRPQTLYAYVSRGRIEVRRDPASSRRSLYRAEDVARLAARAGASRRPEAIAAGSMAWGEASIVTRISTVQHGRLIYRGQDAAALSDHAGLEDVAGLLWNARDPVGFVVPQGPETHVYAALADLAAHSQPSLGRGPDRLGDAAATAIGRLAGGCGIAPGDAPLHQGLARQWRVGDDAADAIRRALVLVADHELNASTFACRVTASTGASIAACLLAGLAALSGPRHGATTQMVAQLAADAQRIGPGQVVRQWLDRHGKVPGFGHPLYPSGDIRAIALRRAVGFDPIMADLAHCVHDTAGTLPTIDFALVGLARATALPADAPFTLFLLGRSIGWAAHAMEHVLEGRLIRPRARYDGPLPPG